MSFSHPEIVTVLLGLTLGAGSISSAWAEAPVIDGVQLNTNGLSIYEVQFNTNGDGGSDYDGAVIDCAGGIVVGKFWGSRPRLIVQDPAFPGGWGGIQVKDWIYPYDMWETAQIGDWIEFTNMLVAEFVGTTFLQRMSEFNPGHNIVSHNNALPPPLIVSVSDIPAPISTNGGWFVENHEAERYESMRLIVRNVSVTGWNLGKERDNYVLERPDGAGCWAADYMNADKIAWEKYHGFVEPGRHFCAVAGVFEQYTLVDDYNRWDYYQLITMTSADLAICGDGDVDGDTDLDDSARFDECLIGPLRQGVPGGCYPPAWTWAPAGRDVQHCLMMDLDYDGDVDLGDFGGLQELLGGL